MRLWWIDTKYATILLHACFADKSIFLRIFFCKSFGKVTKYSGDSKRRSLCGVYNFDCSLQQKNNRFSVNVFIESPLDSGPKLENHMNTRRAEINRRIRKRKITNDKKQNAVNGSTCAKLKQNTHGITANNSWIVVEKWENPTEIVSSGAKDRLEIIICGS